MKRIALLVAAAAAGGLTLASCASLNIDAMPVPGTTKAGGREIVMEFANVLNLPARAWVVMDGTRVGVVTNVALTSRGVDVTSDIDSGVAVPKNIHAVLEQATVLGDTYIALRREPGAKPVPALTPGEKIPLAQTESPPQLEDTIATLANFIGSGSIQRAQNSVIKINRVTPPRPEVRQISARAATDLSDLSHNIDNVNLWLKGLSETTDVMATNTPNFNFWFSEQGVRGFRHNFTVLHFAGPLILAIGTIYYNGYWLVPTLSSAGDALEAFQHSKWAFDEEVPRWQRLATEYVFPERKYPAINITSIVGADGRDLTGNVQQVLRMIGAMP